MRALILVAAAALIFTGCSTVRTYCCWWTFGAEVQEAIDSIGEIPDRPPVDRSGGVSPTEVEPDMVTIYYDFDEAYLRQASIEFLQVLGSHLARNPTTCIKAAGHTCDIGSGDYNIALGERRARSAKDFLIHMGVLETQVEIVSFGEERPASLDRDLNRRVDFFIIRR